MTGMRCKGYGTWITGRQLDIASTIMLPNIAKEPETSGCLNMGQHTVRIGI